MIGLAAVAMIASPVAAAPVNEPRRNDTGPDRPRSKHLPHQGAREIARRLRQQARKDARA